MIQPPLQRRSSPDKASPEVLTPYGWMSLPHAGPYDDATLLSVADKRFAFGYSGFSAPHLPPLIAELSDRVYRALREVHPVVNTVGGNE